MGAGRVPTAAAAAAAKQSSVGLGRHAAVDAVAGHHLLPCHCNPHDLQACAMKTFGENLLREFHARLRLLVAGLASVCASQHRPRWPGPAQRQSVGQSETWHGKSFAFRNLCLWIKPTGVIEAMMTTTCFQSGRQFCMHIDHRFCYHSSGTARPTSETACRGLKAPNNDGRSVGSDGNALACAALMS